MAIVKRGELEPIVGDPDDHRPLSRWTLVTDEPGSTEFALIFEEIAPGDVLPLHTHPVAEAIVVQAGSGEYRLGGEVRQVEAGTVVFVPPGTPHGTRNTGSEPLVIQAVFATTRLELTYLERNPAPGTEDRPPSTVVYDARTGEVQ